MSVLGRLNGSGKVEAFDQAEDGPYEKKDTAYFQYYALLSHQAQMLQDVVRTSTYQKAILTNAERCFRDKIVIDVGAGNGILSMFSAQAGARKVYAVEASNMVENLQHLVHASSADRKQDRNTTKNPWLAEKIRPIHSKMEDVTSEILEGNSRCDTIVSECLGVLLVHERMCESFLDARDRFLRPGGSVFPSAGTICLAPIEDKLVWEEAANKARFWDNKNFYGIDVTPFSDAAWEEVFSSPVVGCFGPLILLSGASNYNVDFLTISKEDLCRFTMPLSFDINQTAVIHGLAGWFDLHFLPPNFSPDSTLNSIQITDLKQGDVLTTEEIIAETTPDLEMLTSSVQDAKFKVDDTNTAGDIVSVQLDPTLSSSYMTTSPYATPTHWQQVRFLFQEPLAVNRGQKIIGHMLCEVNEFRSYTLTAMLKIDGTNEPLLIRHCHWRLDRQVYSWTSASPSTQ